MKKLIAAIFLVSLFLPAVCLAADVAVINHVTAGKIECAPENKGCVVTGPTIFNFDIPKGQTIAKHKFSTLDELIFSAGTFKVEWKIVDDSTGKVVTAVKPNNVTTKNDQEIRHFSIGWEFAAKPGSYTYQVVVDDKVIGSFKISILAGK